MALGSKYNIYHVTIFQSYVFAVCAHACVYLSHTNTIGSKSEQQKHDEYTCSSAANCVNETAQVCEASDNCTSFAISQKWHAGAKAQLYTTHWNKSIFDDNWTLYACDSDLPPSHPAPPAPPGKSLQPFIFVFFAK